MKVWDMNNTTNTTNEEIGMEPVIEDKDRYKYTLYWSKECRSKYRAHQGPREIARRLRQMTK